jgi:hypothetical protein
LSIYELEKGGPLPKATGELLVKRLTHGLRTGLFLFVGYDETPIERRIV